MYKSTFAVLLIALVLCLCSSVPCSFAKKRYKSISLKGEVSCQTGKQKCFLTTDPGSFSEARYVLYNRTTRKPYFTKILANSFVEIRATQRKNRLYVHGIKLAIPNERYFMGKGGAQ